MTSFRYLFDRYRKLRGQTPIQALAGAHKTLKFPNQKQAPRYPLKNPPFLPLPFRTQADTNKSARQEQARVTTRNIRLMEHYKTIPGAMGMGILITLCLSGELGFKKWNNRVK
jgi:hypothetical protein